MPGRRSVTWQEKWAVVEHGTTYGMAQRCYRLNPEGNCCQACRTVWSRYAKELRLQDSDRHARKLTSNSVRSKALWRLARLHPADYHRFVNEEILKIRTRQN